MGAEKPAAGKGSKAGDGRGGRGGRARTPAPASRAGSSADFLGGPREPLWKCAHCGEAENFGCRTRCRKCSSLMPDQLRREAYARAAKFAKSKDGDGASAADATAVAPWKSQGAGGGSARKSAREIALEKELAELKAASGKGSTQEAAKGGASPTAAPLADKEVKAEIAKLAGEI